MHSKKQVFSLLLLRFRLYRDVNGIFYFRVGNGLRRTISQFQIITSICLVLLILFSVLGGVGFVGYRQLSHISEVRQKVRLAEDAKIIKLWEIDEQKRKKAEEARIRAEEKQKSELIRVFKTRDTTKLIKGLSPFLPDSINSGNYKAVADKLLNEGTFDFPPYGSYKFDSNINWYKTENRSFLRFIHGHFMLNDLVKAYQETQNTKYLEKGFEIIKDWVQKNPFSKDTMAWHDETTAVRLMEWVIYFDAARKILSDADTDFLIKNIKEHQSILSDDSFYSKNSNHGMFQDQALLVSADYFPDLSQSAAYKKIAVNRLSQYFTGMYSAEGVHYENTPSYHLLVSAYIKKFGDYIKKTDPILGQSFIDLYNKTIKYATFMVKPNGYLPQIGDTANLGASKETYEDPGFIYAATSGKEGVAPAEADAIFPDPGYAIFRDSWVKKEKATYMFFAAAYKSDVHKHNDDLGLWIYSNGDVVTEAGAYGYSYDDPFTQYGYSSFSHNTLIVDNEGLSTSDKKFGATKIVDYQIGKDVSTVSGVNTRYKDVTHTRNVEFAKLSKTITVNDSIQSSSSHKYQLLWHLAPDMNPVVSANKVTLFRVNKQIGEIAIISKSALTLSVVKGQNNPVQGWYFKNYYQKEPTSVLTVDLFDKNASVTTIFKFI